MIIYSPSVSDILLQCSPSTQRFMRPSLLVLICKHTHGVISLTANTPCSFHVTVIHQMLNCKFCSFLCARLLLHWLPFILLMFFLFELQDLFVLVCVPIVTEATLYSVYVCSSCLNRYLLLQSTSPDVIQPPISPQGVIVSPPVAVPDDGGGGGGGPDASPKRASGGSSWSLFPSISGKSSPARAPSPKPEPHPPPLKPQREKDLKVRVVVAFHV